MSMTPTATERSPWPPGFSLASRMSWSRKGSRLSRASVTYVEGSASRTRGMKRSRSRHPWAYRPLELKPYPTTGLPSSITSVTTAATDTVILLKSINALRMRDAMETVRSWMSTIFILPGDRLSAESLHHGDRFPDLFVADRKLQEHHLIVVHRLRNMILDARFEHVENLQMQTFPRQRARPAGVSVHDGPRADVEILLVGDSPHDDQVLRPVLVRRLLDLFLTRRVKCQGRRSDETGVPGKHDLRPGRLQAFLQRLGLDLLAVPEGDHVFPFKHRSPPSPVSDCAPARGTGRPTGSSSGSGTGFPWRRS